MGIVTKKEGHDGTKNHKESQRGINIKNLVIPRVLVPWRQKKVAKTQHVPRYSSAVGGLRLSPEMVSMSLLYGSIPTDTGFSSTLMVNSFMMSVNLCFSR